ncbi:hypothetical protein ERJ75_000034400 [Trypanosoma vivax]|nr:hypothetical protein ERJ75_000034400 [Trypanosoma vivax]
MSFAIVGPADTAVTAADAENAAVSRLNTLFRRSGLYLSTASMQLHVIPETVYRVSAADVATLAENARVLTTNKDVNCDFGALSGVLWGQVRDMEFGVDAYFHLLDDERDAPRKKAASQRLSMQLTVLAQALHTLRHFEHPFARPEVRDSVNIVRKDVEVLVRLASKLARILDDVVKNIKDSDVGLFRSCEAALSFTELFASAVASRSALDVQPLISLFNSDIIWQLSGVGVLSVESYCGALCSLIRVLFARGNEFYGVERVATQLLLHRLARRPPFNAETFAYTSTRTLAANPRYGILRYMSIVKRSVESLLLSSEAYAAQLRHGCTKAVEKMNEKKNPLSFYQILVLAALQGMPRVDFTEDAPLVQRAVTTQLCTNDQIIEPDFLRILMAHGYMIPKKEHVSPDHASVISLLNSLAVCIVQIPLIQSGEMSRLSHLLLRPPVQAVPLVRLVVAVSDGDAAVMRDVLRKVREMLEIIYLTCFSFHERAQLPKKIPHRPWHFLACAAELLFEFFRRDTFVLETDPTLALECMSRIYAVRALYTSVENNKTEQEKKSILVFLRSIGRRLLFVSRNMLSTEINVSFTDVILPCVSKKNMERRNRQHYALVEAYVRSFASAAVALVLSDENMLRHWVDTALVCIKNPLSDSLAVVGLDFLCSAFLSKRAIAPLFVPTYVTLVCPVSSPARYGEPPLFLARHFARTVRNCCQALEQCDERALSESIRAPNSTLNKIVSEISLGAHGAGSLDSIRPVSSVLLIVSALFDKVCILLGHTAAITTAARQERLAYFQVYYSALINLLQCCTSTVLHRVCASVETVLLDHLRGVPSVQAQWYKHIENVVDCVQGIGKPSVAEWFVMLGKKMTESAPQAKL